MFCLHHTDNPEFYLKELIRVSKKRIVICEDTCKNVVEKIATTLRCIIPNILIGDTNLKRNFKSTKEWRELFKKNNLELITFKRFRPHLNPSLLARNVVIVLQNSSS